MFKVHDQYEQTQWFTAIDAEIREKKEPLPIDVLPMVIDMDSIAPSSSNDSSGTQSNAAILDSERPHPARRHHRKGSQGSLESAQLDAILNGKRMAGRDSHLSREPGAGVGAAAEWHGMDIAADFVSSDSRRAQNRGKNRAFPVQNIAVTRTPLDMGLVDHSRLAHSPELFKDDSAITSQDPQTRRGSLGRRGSADDTAVPSNIMRRRETRDDLLSNPHEPFTSTSPLPTISDDFAADIARDVNSARLFRKQRFGSDPLRRGSEDKLASSGLQTPVPVKPTEARPDWQKGVDVNQEGQDAVPVHGPQQLIQEQLQIRREPPLEPAASSASKEDQTLEAVFAAASEQLKATKDTTARLSRALAVIEEMKARWKALLESEMQRLDVDSLSPLFFCVCPCICCYVSFFFLIVSPRVLPLARFSLCCAAGRPGPSLQRWSHQKRIFGCAINLDGDQLISIRFIFGIALFIVVTAHSITLRDAENEWALIKVFHVGGSACNHRTRSLCQITLKSS